MAKFEIGAYDELQKQLSALGNIDEVAPKMIESASAPLVYSIKERLRQHSDTGDLVRSVKATKPKKSKNGAWISRVQFRGYSKHRYAYKTQEVPNAIKAAGMEYGNSRQQPKPFLDASVKDAEPYALEAMQSRYNIYLGDKGLIK